MCAAEKAEFLGRLEDGHSYDGTGADLTEASPALRDDQGVVMACVRIDCAAIGAASERLQRDSKIVLAAIGAPSDEHDWILARALRLPPLFSTGDYSPLAFADPRLVACSTIQKMAEIADDGERWDACHDPATLAAVSAEHRHMCDQVGELEFEDTPYDFEADVHWLGARHANATAVQGQGAAPLDGCGVPPFTVETYTRCAQASMVTSEFGDFGCEWEWRRLKPDSARRMAAAAAGMVVANNADTEGRGGARVKRRKTEHT